MKVGIIAIGAFILLFLTISGCIQNPPAVNVTHPTTLVTTAIPTAATISPVATIATTVVPTTVTEDGSFVINAIGDHRVGDKFTINGTTNLAPGDQLLVEIISASFGPTNKSESAQFYGTSGTVSVTKGVGEARNQWSFAVDTTGWVPDLYIVTISGIEVQVSGSSSFRLLPAI